MCIRDRTTRLGARRTASWAPLRVKTQQNPSTIAVCPWITGRDRVASTAYPRAPAHRRAGSTGRSRSPTLPFLGGPTRGCRTEKSGQAWAQEKGNSLSWDRQRRTRTRGFPGGPRAPEAHVGNGMTSALGHLSLPMYPLRSFGFVFEFVTVFCEGMRYFCYRVYNVISFVFWL